LRDVTGGLTGKTTTSSRDDIVTATANTTAAVGNHTVIVSKLATVSSSYSDPVPSTTQLGGSEIDVAYGDPNNTTTNDTIIIPAADNTLQQVATYINSANYGVTANVVTDAQGSRLVLVSKASGAAGNLTVTSPALNFTQGTAGVDALLNVDGVPIDSSTNTVTAALPGVTLDLASASPNTQVTVSVAADTSQATQTINNFVSAYNTVVNDINSQFAVDANGNEGALAGNSGLRSLQSQLLSAISFSVSGTGQYVNLQSMGIEMQDDGTLQVNSTALNDALSNHYQDFQNFFQSLSPNGFGNFFGNQMMQMIDPTQGSVGLAVNGLKQTSQSLGNDINDFEARMISMQQELTQQYSALNATLEEYPVLMQQISSQLSSLPSSSKSS
jgi:flagellar hook-associated protein 2